MAERIPAYEPGPSPTARQSTASRSTPASCKACSIKAKARVLCPALWQAVPRNLTPSRTATLRRSEENSIAKIFIVDLAFALTQAQQPDGPRTATPRFRHLFAPVRPTLNPFHDRDSGRMPEILVEAGAEDLFGTVQPVEVEMRQRQPATGI